MPRESHRSAAREITATPGGSRNVARQPARGTALRRKERAENFPVALRILPRRYRTHLGAVYDVARVIDDLGDEAAGDRGELLDEFAADLALIWRGGTPVAPVLQRLAHTVRVCAIEQEPFNRLIAANLRDQRVAHYASYAELLDYCVLSANPIGRIVLAIFDARSADGAEFADRICTALQLIEHWQDVAEDRRAGRIYLPREDLEAFGVPASDLDRTAATPRLRRLLAFETGRAAALLDSGAPLLGLLRGWGRLAVSGYIAGGRAAVDAIKRVDGDVLGAVPRPRRIDVVRHVAGLLRGGWPR